MSDKKDKDDKEDKPRKGKGMVVKLGGALALVAAGGGAVFGMVEAGMIGGGGEAEAKEDKSPKLIRKGEEDPYAPKTEDKEGEGEGGAEVEGEGGSEYRTAYYNFTDEFTSNLRGSTGLVQMSVAASTRRDGRVLMWMKKHELAIRSEMLAVLADTPEEDAYSIAGKEHLRKRLTGAINKVLTETEGFGGVDAVYFKSFLVQ